MRLAWLVVLLTSAIAGASPYDVGWGSVQMGLGPRPTFAGELGTRTARAACGDGECKIGGRWAAGGGIGRWGFELQVAMAPLIDRSPGESWTERTALLWGPHVRYSIVRRFGFDLSVRAGIEHGSIDADYHTSTGCTVEQPHCKATDTTPPDHAAWAASAGLSLAWRLRVDGGFFAIQVDRDESAIWAEYSDKTVSGRIAATTFGVQFGRMFDLRR